MKLPPLSDDCDTPLSVDQYARLLLASLGYQHLPVRSGDARCAAELWADSGGQWLTGYSGELGRSCPVPLALAARAAWHALACVSQATFTDNPIADNPNAHRLIGERAAIAGLSRQGRVSAGGACCIYSVKDGHLALNLARQDDFDLLPAWLEQPLAENFDLTLILAPCRAAELVPRARLLGLACAQVQPPKPLDNWFKASPVGPKSPGQAERRPLVVDLSSLWAGPLAGQLLSQLGARVIKVESSRRPDGARFGPEVFYQLMNQGKASLSLDLKSSQGVEQLRRLLLQADIVIEASRPRALQQMGIVAEHIVQQTPGQVWLSITGFGREEPAAHWVAYGDDAGVEAGLSWAVGNQGQDPVFCGDAIGDPLTGLHGALAAFSLWRAGGGQLIDLSLNRVLRFISGFAQPNNGDNSTNSYPISEPKARKPLQETAPLGADNQTIMGEFNL